MASTRVLFAALFCVLWWASIKETKCMKYKDHRQPLNSRIKDLMDRMTLEEKIGQMAQIDPSAASAQIMKDYFIGGVLSGMESVPAPQATAEDWVNMIQEFQKGSLSTRLGIPMIYGIDAIHGNNNVYKATIFPHNIGLGATRDPELVKRIGAATALETRATGISFALAPCVAVCRDPRWGRCYESYSEDHRIVESMTDIIPGLQGDAPADYPKGFPYVGGKNKVAACAKHYVGDGGTHNGINENDTIIDFPELLSIHMPAYNKSIIKGVSTVMISYSSLNGVQMHANRELISGFLKKKLKFEGFVITDWEGIDRLTTPVRANYTYSLQLGINAGIDVDVFEDCLIAARNKDKGNLNFSSDQVILPLNYTEFVSDVTSLVKKNIIPMSRINDAVRRILRVKFTMGLFENPMSDMSFADQLGKKEHRELAREAVRKSLVLLKNGDELKTVLPLKKKAQKVLVAGVHADNLGYQCGGWTIYWQGASGNDMTDGTTILKAIESTVDPSTTVVYSEIPDRRLVSEGGFSYAILVIGELPYAETRGYSLNLTMADPGPSMIETVCGSVTCVVVVVSGRPIVIEPYVASIDALIAAWLPGSEGQGVADVLYGDYGFTGKLPRTWFRSVDQLPMNFGDEHYDPLFPLGFGLTTKPEVERDQIDSM